MEKYGYTNGCEGCNRMQSGGERRSHTAKCRERMLKAMGEEYEIDWPLAAAAVQFLFHTHTTVTARTVKNRCDV